MFEHWHYTSVHIISARTTIKSASNNQHSSMLRNIPNRCFRPTVDNASKEYRILDPQTPRISAQFPIVLQPVALQAEKITTSVQNLCQDIPMMASCICNWHVQLLLKPIPISWPKNLANNPIKSPFWFSHRTRHEVAFCIYSDLLHAARNGPWGALLYCYLWFPSPLVKCQTAGPRQ